MIPALLGMGSLLMATTSDHAGRAILDQLFAKKPISATLYADHPWPDRDDPLWSSPPGLRFRQKLRLALLPISDGCVVHLLVISPLALVHLWREGERHKDRLYVKVVLLDPRHPWGGSSFVGTPLDDVLNFADGDDLHARVRKGRLHRDVDELLAHAMRLDSIETNLRDILGFRSTSIVGTKPDWPDSETRPAMWGEPFFQRYHNRTVHELPKDPSAVFTLVQQMVHRLLVEEAEKDVQWAARVRAKSKMRDLDWAMIVIRRLYDLDPAGLSMLTRDFRNLFGGGRIGSSNGPLEAMRRYMNHGWDAP